jgi:hypothetical protein
LVLAVFGKHQVEVALLFLRGDLGQEPGLSAAGPV